MGKVEKMTGANKKIVFHSNQLSVRGTEVALYDYAFFNQSILNNKSIVVYNKNNPDNNGSVIEKFKSAFLTFGYDHFEEVDSLIKRHQADLLYCIKSGKRDGKISKLVPTSVHAVFPTPLRELHGAAFAFISDWLALVCSDRKVQAVPHMISLPELGSNAKSDLRPLLNIPPDATVFGCYGGADSFDIEFVRNEVIPEVLNLRPDAYFLFLNISSFIQQDRVIFLPASADMNYKVQFINTTDAMLHARTLGESFGIACGEFSIKNKPVFTFRNSRDRHHLMVLGDRALSYSEAPELTNMLLKFNKIESKLKNWDCYSEKFNPKVVMRLFDEHLIKNALNQGLSDRPMINVTFIEKFKSQLNVTRLRKGW